MSDPFAEPFEIPQPTWWDRLRWLLTWRRIKCAWRGHPFVRGGKHSGPGDYDNYWWAACDCGHESVDG